MGRALCFKSKTTRESNVKVEARETMYRPVEITQAASTVDLSDSIFLSLRFFVLWVFSFLAIQPGKVACG